jgi:hypothetical protein
LCAHYNTHKRRIAANEEQDGIKTIKSCARNKDTSTYRESKRVLGPAWKGKEGLLLRFEIGSWAQLQSTSRESEGAKLFMQIDTVSITIPIRRVHKWKANNRTEETACRRKRRMGRE